MDALILNIREDGWARSGAAFSIKEINEDRYREVQRMRIGDSESETSWDVFSHGSRVEEGIE
ncbi:MAG: transposase [Hydrogenibacillus sp.]|nr:transposase [Hydrogenibacillus sp.]